MVGMKSKPTAPALFADSVTRVLIVDDHELVRNGLAELLESQAGMQVCGRASGELEGWQLARTSHPNLAIIDISLDEGNGIELIKRLSDHDRVLAIVVLSSYDESLYAERALRAGASGYISKQTPVRQIVAALRHVLAGNLYLSERMTKQLVERATGSRGPVMSPVDALSDRELEVFTHIGRALSSRQIAEELHLSPRTVDTYRERLKTKLHVASGTELNHAAIKWVLENG
jgi:DNA-binding NarL/FixJ family response regulator